MFSDSLGIYVHVPFCRARCEYCDFAIVVGRKSAVPRYVERLVDELRTQAARLGPRKVESIHFGGGTPSAIDPEHIARLIAEVPRCFDVVPDCEIGLESNAEDVDAARASAWIAAGVTRLTVGLQSMTQEGLDAIGRPGNVTQNAAAVQTARAASPKSLAVDIIFGRPQQRVQSWQEELEQVCALDVDHVSAYALEVDGATPLVRAIEKGRVAAPDPDRQADMYETVVARFAARGWTRYEISNFCAPGHASRHNLRYWTDRPYLGLGQSAASYVDGVRWTQPRQFERYLEGAEPAIDPFDADRRCGEALVFGLRIDDGVDLGALVSRYGRVCVDSRQKTLEEGLRRGLLEREGERVRLSETGRLIAHEVMDGLL